MKLLCTESDIDICNDIITRLSAQGIDAEIRQRAPSLFDDENAERNEDLHEVWILKAEDADSANAILYPEPDPQA